MADYGWRELGWIPDRLNSESLQRKIFSECETPTSRYLVSLRRASSIRTNELEALEHCVLATAWRDYQGEAFHPTAYAADGPVRLGTVRIFGAPVDSCAQLGD